VALKRPLIPTVIPHDKMRNNIFITLLLTLSVNFAFAQSFNLNSSEFEVGDIYTAKPKILVELAKSTVAIESYSILDSVAVFLTKHDKLIVEIGIHFDSRGSDHSSIRLDKIRAESILDYIEGKGIDASRLLAKGYGKTLLIISDEEIAEMKTEQEKAEAHAVNRRTEFKIIEKNQ